MSTKIFISHNVSLDKDLANILRDKLRLLSKDQIEIDICEDIQGGEDWNNWIHNSIKQSRIFIFLYTHERAASKWCLYEAGLFDGSRGRAKPHLICLKNENLPKPPSPLQRLQAYNANEDSIKKFLVDLLYRGSFTNRKKLNAELFSSDEDELDRTVETLVESFRQRQTTTDYFRRRIEIGPLTIPEKDANYELEKAPITINEATRGFLDLPDNELTWNHIEEKFSDNKPENKKWLHQVKEVIDKIHRGEGQPIQIMNPFDSVNGRKCFPILSAVERIGDNPVKLNIIFVEGGWLESGTNLDQSLSRAPQPYMTVVELLNIARRVRWNILAEYLGYLKHRKLNDQDMRIMLDELIGSLNKIELEG